MAEFELPVDGFTVDRSVDGEVTLTLSDRYGRGEVYTFSTEDAERIGRALLGLPDSSVVGMV